MNRVARKKLTMKDFFKKIRTIPAISKFMLNHYSPYRGAGIAIETFDLDRYFIRVKMPLTRKNRNIVGTHFGGSLYSMVDPFYMLILMHHLGHKYIVWDKSASINFLSPGRSTVYADINSVPMKLMKLNDWLKIMNLFYVIIR
jgi:acyl-coenzyme A thioesterase PaaI-like protein